MRSSLALFIFMLSHPALACPIMEGTYKSCRTRNAEGSSFTEITIEQKIVNRYYLYSFIIKEPGSSEIRTEKYSADGKPKTTTETDQDTGITIKTSTTTRCSGEILNTQMIAQMDAEEFANLSIQTSISGTQLTQVFSGTSLGQPVSETIICD